MIPKILCNLNLMRNLLEGTYTMGKLVLMLSLSYKSVDLAKMIIARLRSMIINKSGISSHCMQQESLH